MISSLMRRSTASLPSFATHQTCHIEASCFGHRSNHLLNGSRRNRRPGIHWTEKVVPLLAEADNGGCKASWA